MSQSLDEIASGGGKKSPAPAKEAAAVETPKPKRSKPEPPPLVTEAHAATDPIKRQEVARNVSQRQRINKPAKTELKRFKVEYAGEVIFQDAINENEAWAIWCDSRKVYPSPNSGGRVITEIPQVADEE